MTIHIIKNKHNIWIKAICWVLVFALSLSPSVSFAQPMLVLPPAGSMVKPSSAFVPTVVKGVKVNPANPLEFDFIVDKGDQVFLEGEFEEEAERLVKYFLASLTTPEEEMWVNLSPYEKDRIIPESFGYTEMGRDLLTQDYMLKQLSASLMYPEDDLGTAFWERVYAKAEAQFGSRDIPMNTFNKIWIVPEKAVVYEHETTAFVVESRLKVMLEEDYVALQKSRGVEKFGMEELMGSEQEVITGVTADVVREILIPEIEKEVNEGETFNNLRQIYHSMILAAWFKKRLYDSFLGKIYVDQNKTKGIEVENKGVKQDIYDQYLEAYKQGVYDYIKDEYDPITQDIIPRKYFSGGYASNLERDLVIESDFGSLDAAQIASLPQSGDASQTVKVRLEEATITQKDSLETSEDIDSTNTFLNYRKNKYSKLATGSFIVDKRTPRTLQARFRDDSGSETTVDIRFNVVKGKLSVIKFESSAKKTMTDSQSKYELAAVLFDYFEFIKIKQVFISRLYDGMEEFFKTLHQEHLAPRWLLGKAGSVTVLTRALSQADDASAAMSSGKSDADFVLPEEFGREIRPGRFVLTDEAFNVISFVSHYSVDVYLAATNEEVDEDEALENAQRIYDANKEATDEAFYRIEGTTEVELIVIDLLEENEKIGIPDEVFKGLLAQGNVIIKQSSALKEDAWAHEEHHKIWFEDSTEVEFLKGLHEEVISFAKDFRISSQASTMLRESFKRFFDPQTPPFQTLYDVFAALIKNAKYADMPAEEYWVQYGENRSVDGFLKNIDKVESGEHFSVIGAYIDYFVQWFHRMVFEHAKNVDRPLHGRLERAHLIIHEQRQQAESEAKENVQAAQSFFGSAAMITSRQALSQSDDSPSTSLGTSSAAMAAKVISIEHVTQTIRQAEHQLRERLMRGAIVNPFALRAVSQQYYKRSDAPDNPFGANPLTGYQGRLHMTGINYANFIDDTALDYFNKLFDELPGDQQQQIIDEFLERLYNTFTAALATFGHDNPFGEFDLDKTPVYVALQGIKFPDVNYEDPHNVVPIDFLTPNRAVSSRSVEGIKFWYNNEGLDKEEVKEDHESLAVMLDDHERTEIIEIADRYVERHYGENGNEIKNSYKAIVRNKFTLYYLYSKFITNLSQSSQFMSDVTMSSEVWSAIPQESGQIMQMSSENIDRLGLSNEFRVRGIKAGEIADPARDVIIKTTLFLLGQNRLDENRVRNELSSLRIFRLWNLQKPGAIKTLSVLVFILGIWGAIESEDKSLKQASFTVATLVGIMAFIVSHVLAKGLGYYNLQSKRIFLSGSLSGERLVHALIHEVAHRYLFSIGSAFSYQLPDAIAIYIGNREGYREDHLERGKSFWEEYLDSGDVLDQDFKDRFYKSFYRYGLGLPATDGGDENYEVGAFFAGILASIKERGFIKKADELLLRIAYVKKRDKEFDDVWNLIKEIKESVSSAMTTDTSAAMISVFDLHHKTFIPANVDEKKRFSAVKDTFSRALTIIKDKGKRVSIEKIGLLEDLADVMYEFRLDAYGLTDNRIQFIKTKSVSNVEWYFLFPDRDEIYLLSNLELEANDVLNMEAMIRTVEWLRGDEFEHIRLKSRPKARDRWEWEKWDVANPDYVFYRSHIDPQVAEIVRTIVQENSDDEEVVVVDLFGGDGSLIQLIDGVIDRPVHFVLVDGSQILIEKARDKLSKIRGSIEIHRPTDIVKNNVLSGMSKNPNIVVASGGLNRNVLDSELQAKKVAKKVFRFLKPGGHFIVTGKTPVLLGSNEFKELGFNVLNTGQPQIFTTSPEYPFANNIYVLQKPDFAMTSAQALSQTDDSSAAMQVDGSNAHLDEVKADIWRRLPDTLRPIPEHPEGRWDPFIKDAGFRRFITKAEIEDIKQLMVGASQLKEGWDKNILDEEKLSLASNDLPLLGQDSEVYVDVEEPGVAIKVSRMGDQKAVFRNILIAELLSYLQLESLSEKGYIPTILDYGVTKDGQFWIKYRSMPDAFHLLPNNVHANIDHPWHTLNPYERNEVFVQLSKQLKTIHDLGFVHLDVKSANFLISRTPEGEIRVMIIDLARMIKQGAQGVDRRIGTMDHQPKADEPATRKLDIYGLGKVFYELVDKVPYQAPAEEQEGIRALETKQLAIASTMREEDFEKRASSLTEFIEQYRALNEDMQAAAMTGDTQMLSQAGDSSAAMAKKLKQEIVFLIIENKETDAQYYKMILEGAGYKNFYIAASSQEALAIAQRESIDFIISDYHLIDETGLDAVELLRKRGIRIPTYIHTILEKSFDKERSRLEKFKEKGWILSSHAKPWHSKIQERLFIERIEQNLFRANILAAAMTTNDKIFDAAMSKALPNDFQDRILSSIQWALVESSTYKDKIQASKFAMSSQNAARFELLTKDGEIIYLVVEFDGTKRVTGIVTNRDTNFIQQNGVEVFARILVWLHSLRVEGITLEEDYTDDSLEEFLQKVFAILEVKTSKGDFSRESIESKDPRFFLIRFAAYLLGFKFDSTVKYLSFSIEKLFREQTSGELFKHLKVSLPDPAMSGPKDKKKGEQVTSPLGTNDHIFTLNLTTKKSGTGLGLYHAKDVVERHGGTIEAINLGDNEDEGVSFTIRLPGAKKFDSNTVAKLDLLDDRQYAIRQEVAVRIMKHERADTFNPMAGFTEVSIALQQLVWLMNKSEKAEEMQIATKIQEIYERLEEMASRLRPFIGSRMATREEQIKIVHDFKEIVKYYISLRDRTHEDFLEIVNYVNKSENAEYDEMLEIIFEHIELQIDIIQTLLETVYGFDYTKTFKASNLIEHVAGKFQQMSEKKRKRFPKDIKLTGEDIEIKGNWRVIAGAILELMYNAYDKQEGMYRRAFVDVDLTAMEEPERQATIDRLVAEHKLNIEFKMYVENGDLVIQVIDDGAPIKPRIRRKKIVKKMTSKTRQRPKRQKRGADAAMTRGRFVATVAAAAFMPQLALAGPEGDHIRAYKLDMFETMEQIKNAPGVVQVDPHLKRINDTGPLEFYRATNQTDGFTYYFIIDSLAELNRSLIGSKIPEGTRIPITSMIRPVSLQKQLKRAGSKKISAHAATGNSIAAVDIQFGRYKNVIAAAARKLDNNVVVLLESGNVIHFSFTNPKISLADRAMTPDAAMTEVHKYDINAGPKWKAVVLSALVFLIAAGGIITWYKRDEWFAPNTFKDSRFERYVKPFPREVTTISIPFRGSPTVTKVEIDDYLKYSQMLGTMEYQISRLSASEILKIPFDELFLSIYTPIEGDSKGKYDHLPLSNRRIYFQTVQMMINIGLKYKGNTAVIEYLFHELVKSIVAGNEQYHHSYDSRLEAAYYQAIIDFFGAFSSELKALNSDVYRSLEHLSQYTISVTPYSIGKVNTETGRPFTDKGSYMYKMFEAGANAEFKFKENDQLKQQWVNIISEEAKRVPTYHDNSLEFLFISNLLHYGHYGVVPTYITKGNSVTSSFAFTDPINHLYHSDTLAQRQAFFDQHFPEIANTLDPYNSGPVRDRLLEFSVIYVGGGLRTLPPAPAMTASIEPSDAAMVKYSSDAERFAAAEELIGWWRDIRLEYQDTVDIWSQETLTPGGVKTVSSILKDGLAQNDEAVIEFYLTVLMDPDGASWYRRTLVNQFQKAIDRSPELLLTRYYFQHLYDPLKSYEKYDEPEWLLEDYEKFSPERAKRNKRFALLAAITFRQDQIPFSLHSEIAKPLRSLAKNWMQGDPKGRLAELRALVESDPKFALGRLETENFWDVLLTEMLRIDFSFRDQYYFLQEYNEFVLKVYAPEIYRVYLDFKAELGDGKAGEGIAKNTPLIASETASPAMSKDVGGIDLAPGMMNLEIQGADGAMMSTPLFEQPIENLQIDGFVPIIINIQPLQNMPMLLGVSQEEYDAQLAKATQVPTQEAKVEIKEDVFAREEELVQTF